MVYMNRSKNPFKSDLFSKIYTCTFEKEKSGYEISMQIYGYDKKAHNILEKIRNQPNYFHKIQHKNEKNPKYKANVTPLVNLIFKDITIDANSKRRFKNMINKNDFRKFIVYSKTVVTHKDILTFLSFTAGSFFVYKHYMIQKMDELRKLGYDLNAAENIANIVEYQFKKTTAIDSQLQVHELMELGFKNGETFLKLPEKALNHIIFQSPLAALVPSTTLAMLEVNDALWEYKLNKEKKDS